MKVELSVPNPYKKSGKQEFLRPCLELTAGPTNVAEDVNNAMVCQPVTFANEDFYEVVDEIQLLLRYFFQTTNPVTFVNQTTGNGGNEMIVTNLADPGETIIVAISGYWGTKVADMGRRYNLNVIELSKEANDVYSFERLEAEIIKYKPVALFVTQGESSAGTLQPLDGLGEICHKHNCLLAVDAVVSGGVVPLLVDKWQIDAVCTGTQKGLGAQAGMTLMTFSPRALYIYTFAFHMLVSVRKALRNICEEGIDNVWKRHQDVSDLAIKELAKLGITHYIKKPEKRFCGVNLFVLPEDIAPRWVLLVDYLLQKHRISLAYGIGENSGKVLRIGFLCSNAQPEKVEYLKENLKIQ